MCNAEYGSLADFHRMVQHEAKTVTCTESGWDVYFVCRDCGYSTKKEIVPLEHDYGPWVLNNNGTHTHTCNRDKNHTETENCGGGTASCNARAVCEKCGAQYGEKDPNHHDLVPHEAKDATCTEVGWKAYDTCKNCSYTTYTEIPVAGHSIEHHEAKDATCTQVGWKAYDTCRNCSYTTYTEIPVAGHSIEHHEAKEATCTEVGWDAYDTCKNCSYTTYTEIPVAGHSIEHHDAKDATCTEVGWKAYDTCSNCSYTTYDELPALSHDYRVRVYAPPAKRPAIPCIAAAAATTGT